MRRVVETAALCLVAGGCSAPTEPLGLLGTDGSRLVAEYFEVGGVRAFAGMYDTELGVACKPWGQRNQERCLPWLQGTAAYLSPDCSGEWVFVDHSSDLLPTRSDAWGTAIRRGPGPETIHPVRLGPRIEDAPAVFVLGQPQGEPEGCYRLADSPLREVEEVLDLEAFVAVERTEVPVPDARASEHGGSTFEAADGAVWASLSAGSAPALTEGPVRIRTLEEVPDLAALMPYVWAPAGEPYELFDVDGVGACNPRAFRRGLRCIPREFGSTALGGFSDEACAQPVSSLYWPDGNGTISRSDAEGTTFEIFEVGPSVPVYIERDGQCRFGAEAYEVGPRLRSGELFTAERVIDDA